MEPSSRTAPGLAPGDVIAGKFRLERVIGRGGMGSVWAARHVQLEMPVALKFIETEGDAPDARVRFEREARAAGQIRSPHVVQILDHGIDGERPYIAMELLEGEDLGQRLRREKRISVPACARILTQAAKALRRAHEAGIIHRDLKPGNIFLARFDDDEVVKVLDFGVAKMRRAGAIEEPHATQAGIVFGSPSYMSPEQARGVQALDHRSDLWSLAVIVYRSVTGVKPFQGASVADLVVKLCVDPLPVATRAARDLPAEIDPFFERAFARDPEQRFASAPEMAAAFEAVAVAAGASPPISSSIPSLPQAELAAALRARAALQRDAPADPTSAFPMSATPPSGSGPMVGFAPGTLTPPPGPSGGPVRAPSLAPFPAEPTPGSGVSSLPSGGWGLLPPASAPPVPPVTADAVHPEPAPPPAPPAVAPVAIAPGARPPPTWTIPRLMAAGAGVGLLALLLLVVVAQRSTPDRSTAQSQPVGHVGGDSQTPGRAYPVHEGATAEPAHPPAPPPAPGEEAPEPAPGVASAMVDNLPAPAESAAAGTSDAGAPHGPARSGKKRRPNFGY
jgi:serine/threonine-protein kinase